MTVRTARLGSIIGENCYFAQKRPEDEEFEFQFLVNEEKGQTAVQELGLIQASRRAFN